MFGLDVIFKKSALEEAGITGKLQDDLARLSKEVLEEVKQVNEKDPDFFNKLNGQNEHAATAFAQHGITNPQAAKAMMDVLEQNPEMRDKMLEATNSSHFPDNSAESLGLIGGWFTADEQGKPVSQQLMSERMEASLDGYVADADLEANFAKIEQEQLALAATIDEMQQKIDGKVAEISEITGVDKSEIIDGLGITENKWFDSRDDDLAEQMEELQEQQQAVQQQFQNNLEQTNSIKDQIDKRLAEEQRLADVAKEKGYLDMAASPALAGGLMASLGPEMLEMMKEFFAPILDMVRDGVNELAEKHPEKFGKMAEKLNETLDKVEEGYDKNIQDGFVKEADLTVTVNGKEYIIDIDQSTGNANVVADLREELQESFKGKDSILVASSDPKASNIVDTVLEQNPNIRIHQVQENGTLVSVDGDDFKQKITEDNKISVEAGADLEKSLDGKQDMGMSLKNEL